MARAICKFPLWRIASSTHLAMTLNYAERVEVGEVLVVFPWKGKVSIDDLEGFWPVWAWLIFGEGIEAFVLKSRRGVRNIIGI